MEELEYDETFPEVVDLQTFNSFDYSHIEVSGELYVSGNVDESPLEWISMDSDYASCLDEMR